MVCHEEREDRAEREAWMELCAVCTDGYGLMQKKSMFKSSLNVGELEKLEQEAGIALLGQEIGW